jgi:hypothetical protein
MAIPTALKVLSPITGLVSGFSGGGRGGRRGRGATTGTVTRPGVVTPSFKRGGKMKKRGVAKLHKGEEVTGKKRRGRSRGR